MSGAITALVGATGGAGTTRLGVEFAATLASEGNDVCVLDAAYATQGLAQYVEGRIGPDLTACCTGDEALAAALCEADVETEGQVGLCPAYAPFERLARAKRPEAAQRFEALAGEASEAFDHVLVDTPPVAANQAVAAVNRADQRVLVTPNTQRGADALPRMADRLRDVGAPADVELANRGPGPVERADLTVGEGPTEVAAAPAVLEDEAFATDVATAVERVTGVESALGSGDGRLGDLLP